MTSRIHGLVVAAGTGSRLGAELPKQYLRLDTRFVVDISVAALQAVPLASIVVALHANDHLWSQTQSSSNPLVRSVTGGASRADSVLAGLCALQEAGAETDWVLVHDAARPLVSADCLQRLVSTITEQDTCGGLLAVPVTDTLKFVDHRAGPGNISHTIPREHIWRAQTPQMFRVGQLQQALQAALGAGSPVTDEASAMELAGFSPRVVEGRADNLKITHVQDLDLARWYLAKQTSQASR